MHLDTLTVHVLVCHGASCSAFVKSIYSNPGMRATYQRRLPAHANSVGSTFVNSVCGCLWYIDGNFQSLSSGVPECFHCFQGYNKPELCKKRKRDESNLKSTELFA